MTNLILKIAIIISMICDCLAIGLVDGEKYYLLYTVLRSIGHMCIPLVCFLLVEGYIRTSSRKKYFLRLLGFGILAEVPYLLLMTAGLRRVETAIHLYMGADAGISVDNVNALGEYVSENAFVYYQDLYSITGLSSINGLLTLTMTFIMILLLDRINAKYNGRKVIPFVFLTTLVIMVALVFVVIIPFENPIIIPLFACLFFFLRGNKPGIAVMSVMATLFFYTKVSMLYSSGVVLAVLIIFNYTGKKGNYGNGMKWVFYAAYPIIMLATAGVAALIR